MGNPYHDFTGRLKHQAFAATASGTFAAVAAPGTSKKLRIHGYRLSASAEVQAQFAAGSTNATLSGTFYLAANGGVHEPTSEYPVLEDLPENTALLLDLNGATTVSGNIRYRILSIT